MKSVSWLFWRRCFLGVAGRSLVLVVFAIVVAVISRQWSPILFAFGAIVILALIWGALVGLSWRTVGKIVTTPAEREAMTPQQKVDAMFSHWWLPARRIKR